MLGGLNQPSAPRTVDALLKPINRMLKACSFCADFSQQNNVLPHFDGPLSKILR